MFRLSRRFTTALLWIAIALLPVRGLAAVVMPIAMVAMGGMQQAGSVQSVAATDEAVVEMPCHAASKAAANSNNTASACSMCELCHTTVAQAPQVSVTLPELPETQPYAAVPAAIEPRAPDGLFRPPRSFLA